MLVCLPGLLPANAQVYLSKVELVDFDNDSKTAVFFSEGYGANKKDAVENSRIAVLRKLLYEGVEGINDDLPIIKRSADDNVWLKDFFNGKAAPYNSFLGEIEVIGDFKETDMNQFYCKTHVVVKYGFLKRQAKIQGLTDTILPTFGSETNVVTPPRTPQVFY